MAAVSASAPTTVSPVSAIFHLCASVQVKINADDASSWLVTKYEETVVDPNAPITGADAENRIGVKKVQMGYADDVNEQRLYVMTGSIIVGLPLFNCSQYKNCVACLSSGDPFCGWCTLENKYV